jgi:hypothetical protein
MTNYDNVVMLHQGLVARLKRAYKAIARSRRPIVFNDHHRTEPISRNWGWDRGTPIDRYYIDRFYADNRTFIKGDVLEVADDFYARRFGHGLKHVDILHVDSSNPKATIVGDLTRKGSIPAERFDCFVCVQTLTCIYDLQRALEGCFGLLKRDGTVLATVNGIAQISEYDSARWGDYYRFTSMSAMRLFTEVFGAGNVDVVTYGNVHSACCFLQGVAVEDLPDTRLLDVNDRQYQVVIGIRATKR